MTEIRIAAIIPTFNEFELLGACVDSILTQSVSGLRVFVINAGKPLPGELAEKVTEIPVQDSFFWTACIESGIECAKTEQSDFCLLTNADTEFVPGSISKLINAAANNPHSIVCSPAYVQPRDRSPTLLYSHQSDLGLLIYGKLRRNWDAPEESPKEPFFVDLTGGQGVLIPMDLFKSAKVDVQNFPHYASDHDLWLQARKLGYKLLLVPQAGIINRRGFNAKTSQNSSLLKRMFSEYSPESWRIMWRLRRKHQGPVLGFVTTFVSFGLRWTVGLPKIIRRS